MLPAYDQYKNTGYQWLPEIPENWQMVRGKNLFEDVDVRSKTGEEELLTVSHITGVTPRKQKTNVTMFQAESLEGYKLCEPGDFVANTMWVWMGAIAVSKYEGLVSPAYNVYRQIGTNYNPNYLDYLLRVYPLVAEYKRHSRGVRSSRLRLYPEQLLRIGFPLPPLEEQNQIVRYLDSKISRIHHLISLKKQEIALLQEMKQAVISHAVTKGLDPNAEIKDSGVEWIGEIPARWKVTTISQIYNIVLGKMLTPTPKRNSDTLENYLCSQNIQWTGINTSEMKQMWFSEFEKKQYRLQNGDVLVTEGGNVGVSCIFKGEVSPCYIQNSVHRVSTKNSNYINNMFLYYWMILAKTSGYLDKICNKATIAHYTKEKLSQTPIVYLQPTEQKEIISYLERICTFIDVLIQNENRFIDRLNEYKTRLISDVVTGKIDVRTILVADPLPEENFNPDEPEIEAEIPGDNE